MGIKGLFTFIKPYGKVVRIEDLQGKRIGIDISYFFYKWGADSIEPYVEYVQKLTSNGNRVLFVFDGKPGEHKNKEVETRRAASTKATNYVSSLTASLLHENASFTEEQKAILQQTIRIESKKAIRPTKQQRQWIKRTFYEQKVFMLKSMEEADELLVALQQAGDIDVIISGDTDLIRLGAERLLVPLDETANTYLELGLQGVLKKLGMTCQQFQEMCVLTGGVPQIEVQRRVDIRKAWSWMKAFGSIDGLRRRQPAFWPCDWEAIRDGIKRLQTPLVLRDWVREDEVDRLAAWRAGALEAPYTY